MKINILWQTVVKFFVIVGLLLFTPFHPKATSIQDDLVKANKFFKEGKFQNAEAIYVKIIKKEPKNYQALLFLGIITLF